MDPEYDVTVTMKGEDDDMTNANANAKRVGDTTREGAIAIVGMNDRSMMGIVRLTPWKLCNGHISLGAAARPRGRSFLCESADDIFTSTWIFHEDLFLSIPFCF
jgi:hypothetical protein